MTVFKQGLEHFTYIIVPPQIQAIYWAIFLGVAYSTDQNVIHWKRTEQFAPF